MMKYLVLIVAFVCVSGLFFACQQSADTEIYCVSAPPAKGSHPHYAGNQPPLRPSPLVSLPVKAVKPEGWLMTQLQAMRDGFIGHLPEISDHLKPNSGWKTMKGRGWEEMPYWLRGYAELAFHLNDKKMVEEAKKWIDPVLSSQDKDGYFGPPVNKEKHDIWPNMVMIYTLRTWYEATGDTSILSFLLRYFQYQNNLPEDHLLPGSWQKYRGGENLDHIYWLYNRTRKAFLLDLADRVYARTYDWESPLLSKERDENWEISGFYHGVNITMGFRYPGIYYQQSMDPAHIQAVERNWKQVWDSYGAQPGGMFGADENIRPGKNGPEQGAETCSMAELMNSYQSLLAITGDITWADRCEEVVYNSLPASMTPDQKALHYLTAPNLISCDTSGLHDFDNSGDMLSFNPWKYRCCQHNVSFAWPYFASNLWYATPDGGAAALFYVPSSASVFIDRTRKATLHLETEYPFGEEIRIRVSIQDSARFPLYLRIPGWCEDAHISVNGKHLKSGLDAGAFARIERVWKEGDRIRLYLPMEVRIKRWETVKDGVSVRRGPVWFSLKIQESWERYGGTDEWPAYQVLPASPWNYGLSLSDKHPESSVRLIKSAYLGFERFTQEEAPVSLEVPAYRLPQWKKAGEMAGNLPAGPVSADTPEETVTLIPMGFTRLRISVFPQVQP
jgi:hypothetical protein